MTSKAKMTIVLNMIVRNEEKTLPRCIASVQSWVDKVVICDTGSTDGTLHCLSCLSSEEMSIPVVWFQDEWKHFGYNRTLAFHHVREVIDPDLWKTTYVLFLDADMILKTCPYQDQIHDFLQNQLPQSQAWYMIQKTGSLEYQNIRWIRLDIDMICQGPTHEYYSLPSTCQKDVIPHSLCWIDDQQDGGYKQHKFTRDIQLLSDFLETHPCDARSWFYLANSYRDAGDVIKAIFCYERRIQLQGWKEEQYLSWIHMGLLYQKQQRQSSSFPFPFPFPFPFQTDLDSRILFCFLQAISLLPERCEAYYQLVRFYRFRKQYELCLLFYKSAISQKPILDQRLLKGDVPLFYEKLIWQYLFDVEVGIFGFYVQQKELGSIALQRLCDSKRNDVPQSIRQWAEQNQSQFYPVSSSSLNT